MGLNGHFDSMLAAEATSLSSSIKNQGYRCSGTPSCAWREKVSQWCYDVADHLNEDRSIVYVAMNILDRYCATFTSPINENRYETSSLSSIFLAVHIAGSGDLTLQELVSMSRGGITVKDIIAEATIMADAITLSEPILTPFEFVRAALQHVSTLKGTVHEQVLLDSASYTIELAVCDNFFSHCKASSLAVAAILNALETSTLPNAKCIADSLFKASSIAVDSMGNINILRTRLSCIYSHSVDHLQGCGAPHVIEDDEEFHTNSTKRSGSFVDTDDESLPHKRSRMEF